MAVLEKGILSNRQSPIFTLADGVNELPNILGNLENNIQVGRVIDIILNNQFPNIEEYGGLNSIGSIFFSLNHSSPTSTTLAKPFFPQTSAYPLVNEMVLIFKLPNTGIGQNKHNESYYYINTISLWNNPHHNAYPNPDKIKRKDRKKDDRIDDYKISEGSTGTQVNTPPTSINLNSPSNLTQATFEERSNIHPLLPFAGDIIYEGRWGNSIRFGSTAATPDTLNNDWSSFGDNGDPITIIRNGQNPNNENSGWIPTTEQINEDLSSIYATSTQVIDINAKNSNYESYTNNPPTKPDQYNKPQVIINSERLVFNAKEDHVLISAAESIFLGANSSLNFSTKEYIIDSPSIKLGKDANESLIKGDVFLSELNAVMTALLKLSNTLSTDLIWPLGAPAPNVAVNTAAVTLTNLITKFQTNIETYKSSNSKTQ